MAKAKNYLAWQSRLILPELGQRVVEVGCGMGNFTGQLLDREAVVAFDIEPDCVQRFKQRYPLQTNIHAFVSDSGDGSLAELARFQPDSCLFVNVLEHIQDDLNALRTMASILQPGGVIVLFVPAFQSLYGPVDKNLGHFRRYRRADIARLAEAAGLNLKKLHYVNVAGFFGWWINAHLLRREILPARQIEIFDRYFAPWLSRLEARVRPPFGLSLFAVLQKR
jgi:SAM-dependent methyltransferase